MLRSFSQPHSNSSTQSMFCSGTPKRIGRICCDKIELSDLSGEKINTMSSQDLAHQPPFVP